MSLNTKIRGIQIKDLDITVQQLANQAVVEDKIYPGAVSVSKLALNSVTEGKIVNGAVTTVKLASGAVYGDKLADNAVTQIKIDSGAVTEIKIADLAITESKIADGAVSGIKLALNSVAEGNLVDGAVSFIKLNFILDEDDMISNSDVNIATQQSIKAYVDSKTGASTFLELTDTPASFVANKGVKVNSGADALEFYDIVDTDEKTKASATDPTAGYLDAKVDFSSIEVVSEKLQVKALGITNNMLAGDIADNKLVEDYVKKNQIQKVVYLAYSNTIYSYDIGDTPVVNSVQVFLNGLLQEEGSGKDYWIDADVITFTNAPIDGDVITVHSIVA